MNRKHDCILLSICIPTFNRCEVLDKTLELYVNDPAFDESVEIVISDNCSTDNTGEVVSKYQKKYNNIFYHRNENNILDENFSKVLSLGNGEYLKLMNDTVTMKSGVLKSIKDILEKEKKEMKPILFYNNISFLNSNKTLQCSNLNELVSNTSFWITWIANYGIWRKDFQLLEDKNRVAHLNFLQVDWTIREICKQNNVIIYFDDYYEVAIPNVKVGLNLFQIFTLNYLNLFDEYLKSKLLNKRIFEIEKYRLFKYFLLDWYIILNLSKNKRYDFDLTKSLKILFKNYGNKLYFYFEMGKCYTRHFIKKIILVFINRKL